jgi:DNA-3-methyladenine glycosylase II
MAKRSPLILSDKVMADAERYLSRSCGIMALLVTTHGSCPLAKLEFRPFQTLVTSIIRQQLSAKAAETIGHRVLEVAPRFCPSEFMAASFETLRAAGLSAAKVKYITGLASRVNDGRLNFDALLRQSNRAVIAALTDLPGVGRWTAEMFLIFGLKRPDVLAIGDAGLQRAVRQLYGKAATLERIGRTWKPYRSVASWYLWRHLDAAAPSGKK